MEGDKVVTTNSKWRYQFNISALLLYLAIITYNSNYFMNNSYITDIIDFSFRYGFLYYATVLCLILSIVSTRRYSVRMIFIGIIITCVGLLVSVKSESFSTLIIIILFMISGYKKDENKILKTSMIVNTIWLVTIILCANLGMIRNITEFFIAGHERRTYLGFTAHIAPIVLMYNLIIFISYKKEEIKNLHVLIFLLATFYLYRYADVRASFAYSILILIIISILNFRTKTSNRKRLLEHKFIRIFFSMILPASVVLSFSMTYLYNAGNQIVIAIDHFFSGRISMNSLAMQRYNIQLFGQLINYNYGTSADYSNGKIYFYLDSSYYRYLYMYGPILLCIALISYEKLMINKI